MEKIAYIQAQGAMVVDRTFPIESDNFMQNRGYVF